MNNSSNVFFSMGSAKSCCGVFWFEDGTPYFTDSVGLDADGDYEVRVEDGWYFYVTPEGVARQMWAGHTKDGDSQSGENSWIVKNFEAFGENPFTASKAALEKYPNLQPIRAYL